LLEKFGPGGTGTRTYFPESRKRLQETYEPVFKAVKEKDMAKLEEYLAQK
jgi:hypothetical protein